MIPHIRLVGMNTIGLAGGITGVHGQAMKDLGTIIMQLGVFTIRTGGTTGRSRMVTANAFGTTILLIPGHGIGTGLLHMYIGIQPGNTAQYGLLLGIGNHISCGL